MCTCAAPSWTVSFYPGDGRIALITAEPCCERPYPTVLVVDDHEVLRTVCVQVLSDEGLCALEASTGDVGLRIAEQQQPDVILLDLAMPGRSGLDVLQALRQRPATRDIAVIVMSDHSTLLMSEQLRCAAAILTEAVRARRSCLPSARERRPARGCLAGPAPVPSELWVARPGTTCAQASGRQA